ncbi:unnamed protein product, partial [Oikopleura dioica]
MQRKFAENARASILLSFLPVKIWKIEIFPQFEINEENFKSSEFQNKRNFLDEEGFLRNDRRYLVVSLAGFIFKLSTHTSEFVNEVINNALHVERDFINLRYPDEEEFDAEEDDPQFSFFHHPFILNTEKKTKFLFYDSREKQVILRRQAEVFGRLSLDLPYLIINVSRDNIIQDTLIQLEMVIQDDPAALQKQFMVQFDGEQGIDEGGVSKGQLKL